jgi:putative transposase
VAQPQRLLEGIRTVYARPQDRLKSSHHRRSPSHGKRLAPARMCHLMASAGLAGHIRRYHRITSGGPAGAAYRPDHMPRSSVAQQPDRISTSDISPVWTAERWLNLAVVLDMYTRMVVSCASGRRIDSELARPTLGRAFHRQKPTS